MCLLTWTLSPPVLRAEGSCSVASALSSAAFRPLCLRTLLVTGVRGISAAGRSLEGVNAGLLNELIDLSSLWVPGSFLVGFVVDKWMLRLGDAARGDDATFGDKRGCIWRQLA